ncbi:hypothetical protein PNOK_0066200 [Pyrrhoderma noxium]|uniref:Uncharacterized protein n=1 Tax=Pyrrhoderma noxium TaxID=2282107 RepID=A0A286UVL3_9AGAM|nr:hypothetical protein PNOK_0066200 [Pyrrhoderma noxium]
MAWPHERLHNNINRFLYLTTNLGGPNFAPVLNEDCDGDLGFQISVSEKGSFYVPESKNISLPTGCWPAARSNHDLFIVGNTFGLTRISSIPSSRCNRQKLDNMDFLDSSFGMGFIPFHHTSRTYVNPPSLGPSPACSITGTCVQSQYDFSRHNYPGAVRASETPSTSMPFHICDIFVLWWPDLIYPAHNGHYQIHEPSNHLLLSKCMTKNATKKWDHPSPFLNGSREEFL